MPQKASLGLLKTERLGDVFSGIWDIVGLSAW